MEALAIICPLDISGDARAWIEEVRARHDPQHHRVEAHFTLVFPMSGVPATVIAQHVERNC